MATTKPKTNPALPIGAVLILVIVVGLIVVLKSDADEVAVVAAVRTGEPIKPISSPDGDSTQDALRALRAEQVNMLEENARLRNEKEDLSVMLKEQEEARAAELKEITETMSEMAQSGSADKSEIVDEVTDQFNDMTAGLVTKIADLEAKLAEEEAEALAARASSEAEESIPSETLPAPVPDSVTSDDVSTTPSDSTSDGLDVALLNSNRIPTMAEMPMLEDVPFGTELPDREPFQSSSKYNSTSDVVWVRSFDQKAADRVGANGRGSGAAGVADFAGGIDNIGGLLTTPTAPSSLTGGDDPQLHLEPVVDPNVVASQRTLQAEPTIAIASDQISNDVSSATTVSQTTSSPAQAVQEEEDEVEPYITIPDGSVLANATAITSLMGIVYQDNNIVNPIQVKILIGRDNLSGNYTDLPDEIEGMIFGGYAVGVPAFGCVSVNLTYATFVFSSGEIETTYIDDPGARPSNEAYRQDTIGYLSDEYGNPCIAGEYITDAPKQIAALTLLDAASGYASALRQQEVDTSVFSGASGNVVVEELNGSPSRFATATGLTAGFDNASELLREKYSTIYEAYFVPGGTTVSVHLEAELRIDREPESRLVSYQNGSGFRRSLD